MSKSRRRRGDKETRGREEGDTEMRGHGDTVT